MAHQNKFMLSLVGCALLLSVFGFILKVSPMAQAKKQEKNNDVQGTEVAPHAKSTVLMDADSGTIIYEKNSAAPMPPASITKVMTMLLVMEALDEGKIHLSDKIRTSKYAASMGGSQIFLETGEEMSVEDLLKGVALASGNDASVALAEGISGNEPNFVALMNKRGKQLGLKDTVFKNCNGLPEKGHVSSAKDIALISRELLRYDITKFTGVYQDYLRKGTKKPFWLVNTNKLVRFYNGADGLKTGFTSEAKFCLAATAKRNTMRLIAVVMGEPSTKIRNAEVSHLFDHGFSHYTNVQLFKKGDQIGTLAISKGQTKRIPLMAKRRYSVLLKRNDAGKNFRQQLVLQQNLKAPIKKGQHVGKLVIFKDKQILTEFPIMSPVAVKRASWFTLLRRSTSQLFFTKEN